MSWTPKHLVFDFETRSAVDLSESSYKRYASDRTTSILCIGLKWNDRPASCFSPSGSKTVLDGSERPIELMEAIRIGCPILVHNAAFEKSIYRYICVEQWGWPSIPDHQWVDTMAVCAYYAIPQSLQKAAIALGLEKQKDMAGNRVLKQVCKPRSHGKKAKEAWIAEGKPLHEMPIIWWEDKERLARVYLYCTGDVETQEMVYLKLGALPPERHREWMFDEMVNERGIPIDWAGLHAANQVIEESLSEYNLRVQQLTATPAFPKGMVQTINQRQKILDWCELKGWCMVSLSKESVEDALKASLPAPVREILTIRQESGKSSLGKVDKMLNLTDDDGRIRHSMAWHGAATGRKAGRGMQPHNFPRDCMKAEEAEKFHEMLRSENPFADLTFNYQSDLMTNDPQSIPDVVSQALRSFFLAGPGRTFYVSDFSNIETRILAWVSKCRLLNEAFAKGECPYIQFASRAYNVNPNTLNKKSPERQLGKVAVLGLGYGMGWEKFITTAAGPAYNVILDEARSKEIVKLYRGMYTEVSGFWSDCESAFMEAIQSKTQIQCGRVAFGSNGEWGWIVLPSGRPIWMCEPKVSRVPDRWREGKTRLEITYSGVHPVKKTWVRRGTYGGSLVESICQGTAGDILQEALVRVETAGYPAILSVHDELVSEVDERAPFDQFHQLMRVRPAWAHDLPIECESHQSKRYGK
jgi:DNA polymerase